MQIDSGIRLPSVPIHECFAVGFLVGMTGPLLYPSCHDAERSEPVVIGSFFIVRNTLPFSRRRLFSWRPETYRMLMRMTVIGMVCLQFLHMMVKESKVRARW